MFRSSGRGWNTVRWALDKRSLLTGITQKASCLGGLRTTLWSANGVLSVKGETPIDRPWPGLPGAERARGAGGVRENYRGHWAVSCEAKRSTSASWNFPRFGWSRGRVSIPHLLQLVWTASLLPHSYALECKMLWGTETCSLPKAETAALACLGGNSSVIHPH